MNNPWLQKLVTIILGVGIIVLGSYMTDPTIKDMLLVLAGAVIGLAFPELGKLGKGDGGSGGTSTKIASGVGSLFMPVLMFTYAITFTFTFVAFVSCGGSAKDVVWPTVAKCLPAPTDVMNDVFAALKNDAGGSLSDRALKLLEGLARKHGAAAVVCAANDIADRLAADGDPESTRVSNKAKEFVAKTETRVEE